MINQFWMPPAFVIATFGLQMIHVSIRMSPALWGCKCHIFKEDQIAWQVRQPVLGLASILTGVVGKIINVP